MADDVIGIIEAIGRQGVRGWVAGAAPSSKPLRLAIRIGSEEVAHIATPLHRPDVVAAGLSADPRCGFEFLFAEPLPPDAVQHVSVVRLSDGVP
jgi:hypothetical protein